MGITIDTTRCTGCGVCIYICPVGVLELVDMKARVNEGCISCGKCENACAFFAITLEEKPKKK